MRAIETLFSLAKYEFVMNFEVCCLIGPKKSLDHLKINKKCTHSHSDHLMTPKAITIFFNMATTFSNMATT